MMSASNASEDEDDIERGAEEEDFTRTIAKEDRASLRLDVHDGSDEKSGNDANSEYDDDTDFKPDEENVRSNESEITSPNNDSDIRNSMPSPQLSIDDNRADDNESRSTDSSRSDDHHYHYDSDGDSILIFREAVSMESYYRCHPCAILLIALGMVEFLGILGILVTLIQKLWSDRNT